MRLRFCGFLSLLLALMSFAVWRLATQSSQVHAQTQKLYLSTARQFKASYKGSKRAMSAIAGRPSALAMTAADLDGDGVSDLAIGFASSGSGMIAIHRGNLDAFAPQSEASFNAIGRGDFPAPFLPDAELIEIPARPDFLASGDLIGESGSALAAAARGGENIYVLARGASGKMEVRQTVPTSGAITGLDAYLVQGKYWQVAAGIHTQEGSQLVIYSGSNEGLTQTATFPLTGDATAFAAGNLDGDGITDLLAVAGGQLAILHGGSQRLDPVSMPFTVTAAALGRFLNDRDPLLQMALMSSDGRVHIMARDAFDATPFTTEELQTKRRAQLAQMKAHLPQPQSSERKVVWQEIENYPTLGVAKAGGTPLMFRTRISSSGPDDLALIGVSKLSVLAHFDANPAAGIVMDRSDLAADAAVAMPLRVNIDGRPGIVFIPRGKTEPQAMMPLPDPTFNVNTTNDTVDKNPGDGVCADVNNQCSLRAAIMEANAFGGTDTIMIPNGTYTLTIPRAANPVYDARTGTLDVTDSVNIVGSGQTTTIIQGGTSLATSVDKVFSFNQDITAFTNATVAVSNLTIQNGMNRGNESITDGWGGAFDCDTGSSGNASVTLTNVTINNNKLTQGQGGGFAIFNTNGGNGSVTVSGGAIENNVSPAGSTGAGGDGGGIFVGEPANLIMTGTQVTGNSTTAGGSAKPTGGGLFINGHATLHNVSITSNSAAGDGGGIWANSDSLTIDQTSIISTNTSAGNGGGLWFSSVSGEPATLSEVTMLGNSAVNGGGVYVENSDGANFTMHFGRLVNNTASGSGADFRWPTPDIGSPGIVNITDNWWGTNSPASVISIGNGTTPYIPYIVLHVSTNPATVKVNQTSTITADLSKDSNGGTVTDLAAFTGLPVTFTASGGSITTPVNLSAGATANSTFTAGGSAANGSATATFDNQSISVNLTIVAPPSMTVSFSPTLVTPNTTSQLTLTVTNANLSPIDASFTDTLPSGLVVANPNGLTNGCGGSVTATAGTGTISFSNASFATGSCTIKVNVVSATDNTYTNTVTINSTAAGNGSAASGTLTVANPPSITKAFGASTAALNGTTSLTFTISNPNTHVALSGVAFSDTFPAGLVVASSPNPSNTCNGSFTAAGGTGSVNLAGGTIAAAGSCAASVTVQGTQVGSLPNTVQVTSTNAGTGNTSNASLTVIASPTFSKAFGAASIPLNGSTSLTFNLANINSGTTLHNISFSDTLPAGLAISTPNGLSGSCGGGTILAVAGTNVVSLSGAALSPGAPCSFSVNVTGIATGVQNNVTGTVSSTEGGAGTTASASVTVSAGAPSITKSFGASSIPLNSTTTLMFNITNPNASMALSGVAFTDTFPLGLVVGATPNPSNTCNGTLLAGAGAGSVSLAGGSIPGGASCVVSVTVKGTQVGSLPNIVQVTSSNAGAGNTSTASLTVIAPPTFSKSFGVATIPLNGSTSLTFNLANINSGITLHNIAFNDTLPAGLAVSTPNGLTGSCGGGTITATAGAGVVSLSGGALAPGAPCSFAVDVTGIGAGVQNNVTSAVTSTESGAGSAASASITVAAGVAAPVISAAFGTPTMQVGGSDTLTFTIANPTSNTVALTGVAFTDVLPAGLMVGNLSGFACNGTLTTSGGNTISLSGASIAVNSQCQFSVTVTATVAATFNNVTGNVSSTNGGTGNTASASVTASQGAIGGSIGLKSGPTNARVWPIVIGNNGPGTAANAEVTSFVLTQTRGTACTPVIVSPMPVLAGDIAAKATAPANVVIDFTSCTGVVLFKATVGLSADGGATTGSFVALNQLQ